MLHHGDKARITSMTGVQHFFELGGVYIVRGREGQHYILEEESTGRIQRVNRADVTKAEDKQDALDWIGENLEE